MLLRRIPFGPCLGLALGIFAGNIAHAAQTSKTKAAPRPRPVPSPHGLVLSPKVVTQTTPPPATEFHLAPKSKDQLTLSFFARDPAARLDPKAPYFIQLLSPEEGLELEPSVLTPTEWPKVLEPLTIAVKGGKAGQSYEIIGEAAYTVCGGKGATGCRKIKTPIAFTLKR